MSIETVFSQPLIGFSSICGNFDRITGEQDFIGCFGKETVFWLKLFGFERGFSFVLRKRDTFLWETPEYCGKKLLFIEEDCSSSLD